jgi:hypothetical protein
MALPIIAIARVLGQLTVLVPAAETLVRALRRTVSKIPENPSAVEHLDDIERALKLQVEVTENLAGQLRMVQSGLADIQRSLKILVYATSVAAVLAVAAIIVALLK